MLWRWLIYVPAVAVDLLFRFYAAFLAVMTLVCFVCVLWSLMASYWGWPALW